MILNLTNCHTKHGSVSRVLDPLSNDVIRPERLRDVLIKINVLNHAPCPEQTGQVLVANFELIINIIPLLDFGRVPWLGPRARFSLPLLGRGSCA